MCYNISCFVRIYKFLFSIVQKETDVFIILSRDGDPVMIELTKLDETRILVNEDHILTVEETPDTVITFVTGSKILVKEGRNQIYDLVLAFRGGFERR